MFIKNLNRKHFFTFLTLFFAIFISGCSTNKIDTKLYSFTNDEIEFLESFTLKSLSKKKSNPSNIYFNNDLAVNFGRKLFFDIRFSHDQSLSCATCHNPNKNFTDGLSLALGAQKLKRNTPSIVGAVYSDWFYWDGRKDSLWSQALSPFENKQEQGISRVVVAKLVAKYYKTEYQNIFGLLPNLDSNLRFPNEASPVQNELNKSLWEAMDKADKKLINRVFANVGKAIAAYEATLLPKNSNFDFFVAATKTNDIQAQRKYMSPDAVLGMRLFMGRGRCASCHNGPLFTNFEFHNIGVPERDNKNVDLGRFKGAKLAANDEFNCLSPYSDADKKFDCGEIRFVKQEGRELIGAFKTPSLRNVAQTKPYMHAGQFATLHEVLSHYNSPIPPFFDPEQHTERPHFDLFPLNFNQKELQSLIVFLEMLSDKN